MHIIDLCLNCSFVGAYIGYSEENLAGWVARTRPLAEPLSPRGPQPVPVTLGSPPVCLNGPREPSFRYAGRGTSAPPVPPLNLNNLLKLIHLHKPPHLSYTPPPFTPLR